MIRLEGLRFGYRLDAPVLQLDRFELAEGRDLLIAGPSGCGKTTLLHLIAGLLVPSAGRVVVDGQDLAALSPAARDRFRGRRIGIVLQQFHLLPTITAMQNLLVAQSIAGLPVDRGAATSVLNALGIDERLDAFPHQLSVGQQQRVAIARALVNRPRLVLADEPTSNLDDAAAAAVIDLLLGATQRQGATLVVATHDSRLKSRIATELALSRAPVAVLA
jgi:putative ABC transport system ATP-binding protein